LEGDREDDLIIPVPREMAIDFGYVDPRPG